MGHDIFYIHFIPGLLTLVTIFSGVWVCVSWFIQAKIVKFVCFLPMNLCWCLHAIFTSFSITDMVQVLLLDAYRCDKEWKLRQDMNKDNWDSSVGRLLYERCYVHNIASLFFNYIGNKKLNIILNKFEVCYMNFYWLFIWNLVEDPMQLSCLQPLQLVYSDFSLLFWFACTNIDLLVWVWACLALHMIFYQPRCHFLNFFLVRDTLVGVYFLS